RERRRIREVQELDADLSFQRSHGSGVFREDHVVVSSKRAADPRIGPRRIPKGEWRGELVGSRIDVVVEPIQRTAWRLRIDTSDVRPLHAAEGPAIVAPLYDGERGTAFVA